MDKVNFEITNGDIIRNTIASMGHSFRASAVSVGQAMTAVVAKVKAVFERAVAAIEAGWNRLVLSWKDRKPALAREVVLEIEQESPVAKLSEIDARSKVLQESEDRFNARKALAEIDASDAKLKESEANYQKRAVVVAPEAKPEAPVVPVVSSRVSTRVKMAAVFGVSALAAALVAAHRLFGVRPNPADAYRTVFVQGYEHEADTCSPLFPISIPK